MVGDPPGAGVVIFEIRLKQVSLKQLIGAAFGSVLGILGAYLISLVLGRAMPNSYNTIPFLQVVLLAWMTYCGLVVGAAKGDMPATWPRCGGLFGGEKDLENSLQNSGHQRHYRWAHRRYRRDRLRRRHPGDPAVSCCASCNWWRILRIR